MPDRPYDLRGIIDNSMLEWDNRIAAVAVSGGCNLRCPYCHSWRYVTGLDDLQPLDPDRLLGVLRRQRGWIDGVVFTGGEPTLQPGLADMMQQVRRMGYAIKLHTNGTRPDVVRALLDRGLLTTLSLDYKAPLDQRFFAAAGVAPNPALLDAVRQSFALAAAAGAVGREYHTTLAPQFITEELLAEMGAALEPNGVWYLQQFENTDCLDAKLSNARQYDNNALTRLESVASAAHERVVLKRGSSE